MVGRFAVAVALALAAAAPAGAAGSKSPEQVRPRVDHHLRHAEQIAGLLESSMNGSCQRFASPAEWKAYLDTQIDRMVLLLAHLEQAWLEAKETGDDEVRRAAKAPRKRVDEARVLLDRLHACAGDNGAAVSSVSLWRRIEREVPRRQQEVALPPQ